MLSKIWYDLGVVGNKISRLVSVPYEQSLQTQFEEARDRAIASGKNPAEDPEYKRLDTKIKRLERSLPQT